MSSIIITECRTSIIIAGLLTTNRQEYTRSLYVRVLHEEGEGVGYVAALALLPTVLLVQMIRRHAHDITCFRFTRYKYRRTVYVVEMAICRHCYHLGFGDVGRQRHMCFRT